MKRTTGLVIALILIVGTSVGAFASGSSEVKDYKFHFGSSAIADQKTVGKTEVSVPQSVKDYFVANAFGDASYIDAPLVSLTQTQKDNIDLFIANHKDDLDALVRPALREGLVRGTTEVATLRVGRIEWSMDIVGPEDEE